MKKTLLAIASAILAISLVSCSNSSGGSSDSNNSTGNLSAKTISLSESSAGDIILKNGKVVSSANISEMSAQQKNDVVAIIYAEIPNTNKRMGMGLEVGKDLAWAIDTANGRFGAPKSTEAGKNASMVTATSGDFGQYPIPTLDENLFPLWREYIASYDGKFPWKGENDTPRIPEE